MTELPPTAVLSLESKVKGGVVDRGGARGGPGKGGSAEAKDGEGGERNGTEEDALATPGFCK